MKSRVQALLMEEVQKLLKAKKLTVVEVAEIIYMLSKADDETELIMILEFFKSKFDVFSAVLDGIKSKDKEAFELIVSKLIPKVISDDPVLASKIVARSQEDGVTMETLKTEFPTLINYLN